MTDAEMMKRVLAVRDAVLDTRVAREADPHTGLSLTQLMDCSRTADALVTALVDARLLPWASAALQHRRRRAGPASVPAGPIHGPRPGRSDPGVMGLRSMGTHDLLPTKIFFPDDRGALFELKH